MTKSLRTENVIQFVNNDKKSNMKNKFDDISIHGKIIRFLISQRKFLNYLTRFTMQFSLFSPENSISYLHTNYRLA